MIKTGVSNIEDRDLVIRVDGYVRALEAIYGRYRAQAFGLAMRVTGRQRANAEATQNAFLRLWRTGVAGGAELLERGVDVDGVPQDDGAEHRAERAELVRNRSIDQPLRESTEQMTDDALAMPGQLEIQRHADSHGVVLALRGELDLASAPEVEQKLREIEETQPGRILIDLRNLDFMDCTGISLMIRARQSAHANGHLLALRRAPNQVQRLFQVAGLLDHFTFLDERPPRRDAPAVSSGMPEPVEQRNLPRHVQRAERDAARPPAFPA